MHNSVKYASELPGTPCTIRASSSPSSRNKTPARSLSCKMEEQVLLSFEKDTELAWGDDPVIIVESVRASLRGSSSALDNTALAKPYFGRNWNAGLALA